MSCGSRVYFEMSDIEPIIEIHAGVVTEKKHLGSVEFLLCYIYQCCVYNALHNIKDSQGRTSSLSIRIPCFLTIPYVIRGKKTSSRHLAHLTVFCEFLDHILYSMWLVGERGGRRKAEESYMMYICIHILFDI